MARAVGLEEEDDGLFEGVFVFIDAKLVGSNAGTRGLFVQSGYAPRPSSWARSQVSFVISCSCLTDCDLVNVTCHGGDCPDKVRRMGGWGRGEALRIAASKGEAFPVTCRDVAGLRTETDVEADGAVSLPDRGGVVSSLWMRCLIRRSVRGMTTKLIFDS